MIGYDPCTDVTHSFAEALTTIQCVLPAGTGNFIMLELLNLY